MRLIDADALIEDIKTKLWDWNTVDSITSSTVLKQTITDIGNAPTIDAVQVIRCKDCKHSRNDELWHMRWCKGLTVNDEHFCADGERKDDDGQR